MQPRSALFDATVANAHTLLVRADILSGGQVIATGLPVVSGSVSGNRSQFARRTCSVVIGDPAYMPTGYPGRRYTDAIVEGSATPAIYPSDSLYPSATLFPSDGQPATAAPIAADLLTPYGNEVRLWRGAVTPVGPELICVGTFGIRSVEFNSGSGAFDGIAVTGIDRSKVIAEARFPYPRTTIGNVSAIGLVRSLVLEVLPWVEVRVDPATWDTAVPQVTWPSNRDAAITDLLASVGAEGFFDPYGAFVIQPIPSPYGPPVFTAQGGPGGVLVSARHSLSRDGVCNGVVARGQSTSSGPAPTSSLIVDNDPSSPTYWYGEFGQVVGFYDSSLLVDSPQCDNAAQAMLLDQMGAARSINYSTAVNPALEPGDVVAVVDPDTGVTERHLQDQLTIPLDAAGLMTAQTRSTLSTTPPIKHAVYTGSLS